MVSSKHAFWQALVFTIIIFGLGLLLGFFLENSRSSNVQNSLINSEINLADEQVRNNIITNLGTKCDVAEKSTFNFADRIYHEAVLLEKYDSSSKFTDTLKVIHRRYDLLRMILWSEAISNKKECKNSFHTVVYLYDYDTDDLTVRAEQAAFSKVLLDLKEKHPDKILLIPIAADLDLGSVNLVLDQYDIKKRPAIIIDENETILDLVNVSDMEKVIFKSNKE